MSTRFSPCSSHFIHPPLSSLSLPLQLCLSSICSYEEVQNEIFPFITPSLLSVRMLLLSDTDLFKIGGKGQLESHFLTTQLKMNTKKSKLSAFIQTKIEHHMNINDTKIIINRLFLAGKQAFSRVA